MASAKSFTGVSLESNILKCRTAVALSVRACDTSQVMSWSGIAGQPHLYPAVGNRSVIFVLRKDVNEILGERLVIESSLDTYCSSSFSFLGERLESRDVAWSTTLTQISCFRSG